MSKLEDLINSLCPEGVASRRLCDISKMSAGDRITKSMMSDNYKYPVMGAGIVPTGYYTDWNRENTITISRAGVGAGIVGWHPEKFWATDVCFTVDDDKSGNVNIKYLYYVIKSQEKNRKDHIYGGSMPKIDKNYLWHMQIPVPPLEIQNEITRILDNFTELTAELTARKKQFEYYRNQLISAHNNNVHSNKLSEIASIYDGTHQTPKYQETGIPFVSVENIANIYDTDKYISLEEYNLYKVKPQLNDLFMTRIGTVGKCAIVNKLMDLAYYVSLALIRPDSNIIDTRYLKYYIESSLGKKELSKRVLHHAVPVKINKEDIGKIMISYPEMSIQKKIADLLDNFECICADLDIGLPAEIEARQKQYEFYLDQLLTFVQTGHSILTDRQTDRQNLIKLFQYVFGYAIVKISNIAVVSRGQRVTKKDLILSGQYPVYQNSLEPLGYLDKYNYSGDKTFIISAGAAGNIGFSRRKFWAADDCLIFLQLAQLKEKYIYYYLKSIQGQIDSAVRKASIPRLAKQFVENIDIIVPTIEKQDEIIELLDKFESISEDFQEGIPAEIEACKKQYEYYRDKLLSFEVKCHD